MNSNSDQNNQGQFGRARMLWPLLLLLLLPWILNYMFGGNESTPGVTYTMFREQLEQGNIERVELAGERVTGVFREPVLLDRLNSEPIETKQFTTYLPTIEDPSLLAEMRDRGVLIDTRTANQISWTTVMVNLLPLGLFIIVAIMFFRRARSSGDDFMGMVKSRAHRYDGRVERVTFDDVAGAEGAKGELAEIVNFLREPMRYRRLGARVPKGVLLVGPPGTGKTLLARAVAGEANVPFFSISGSDFMEMFVGVGAGRVRDLFDKAKKHSPSIIFIDELDSIGRRRGTGIGGGHDEREQTLNQLLSEMDGFEKNEYVIVMAATNRPDILDPALQRPGRFDRQVQVDLPTLPDRVEILKIHARNKPIEPSVDLERVARGTPGFSGADLANLLNEAALLAARRDKNRIDMDDISDARDKVIMGLERKLQLTAEEMRLLAYHEAGHALVAAYLPNTDPVHKVTIIPRGRAMGVTQQLPERDRYLYPRDYMLDRMAVMMGGRAAEEIGMGTMTSGAANDFKQATRLARLMVLEWGMSERVGRIALGGEDKEVFLGEDLGHTREYSEQTAREVDIEVHRLLDEAYERARSVLETHRDRLDLVVDVLVDREQISGETLLDLLGLQGKKSLLDDEPETREDAPLPQGEDGRLRPAPGD